MSLTNKIFETFASSSTASQSILFNYKEEQIPVTEDLKIKYTTSDSNPITMHTGFGPLISNSYDAELGCFVAVFKDTITEIPTRAFEYYSTLTSIELPESTTGIGVRTFGNCTALTSIIIPDNVIGIGQFAFNGCPSLTSVTFGALTKSLGGGCFGNCGLTTVTLPSTINSIGESVFFNCANLTTVVCEMITPPAIDVNIIEDCNKINAILIPKGSKNNYLLTEGWNQLPELFFIEMPEIQLPLNEIWYTAKRKVYLGDNMAHPITFDTTEMLGANYLPEESTYDPITQKGVLKFNGPLLFMVNPEYGSPYSYLFWPEGIEEVINSTQIDNEEPSWDDYMICLALPYSISRIDTMALIAPTLQSITLPAGLRILGTMDSIGLGFNLFLNSLTVPESVLFIGKNAINSVYLTSVTVKAIYPPMMSIVNQFNVNANTEYIYVPAESVDDYKAAEGWSKYANKIQAIPT